MRNLHHQTKWNSQFFEMTWQTEGAPGLSFYQNEQGKVSFNSPQEKILLKRPSLKVDIKSENFHPIWTVQYPGHSLIVQPN